MNKLFIFCILFYLSLNISHSQWVKLDVSHTDILVNEGRIFVYTFQSLNTTGIYISTDNGDTWFLKEIDGLSISLIEAYNNYLYASTSKGIYRSTDNGDTWQATSYTLQARNIATDNNFVLVTSSVQDELTISLSSDYGDTWNDLNTIGLPTNNNKPNVIEIKNNTIFFGFDYSGLYRSTNFGEMWEKLQISSIIPLNETQYIWSIYTDNENTYVSVMAETNGKGLYVTSDNGDTWNRIGELYMPPIPFYMLISNNNFWVVSGGSIGTIFHSNDDGQTWEKLTQDIQWFGGGIINNIPSKRTIDINEHTNSIFAVCYAGIYRSNIDDITSVNDLIQHENKLTIFPNPATELIHISTDALITRSELTDILGRTVFKQSGNVEQISTAGLATGLYLLKLYTAGGEVLTEKVVVR